MALQTFRHLSDYNFSQVVKARDAEAEAVAIPFMDKSDGIEAEPKEDQTGLTANYLFKRAKYWAGKIITFPIGERWLAISLSAAIGGAFLTFTAMPVLALISMIWVYRVRLAKSIAMAKTRIRSTVISKQFDLGFKAKPLTKRLDWLEPSVLRAFELGSLIVLFALSGNFAGPAAVASFVILFSIAFNHYDNLYRSMQSEHKPSWLSIPGLTVLGRMALLGLAVYLGLDLNLFAAYFFVWFLVVSSLQWVVSNRAKALS
jgi:hypothetical protein